MVQESEQTPRPGDQDDGHGSVSTGCDFGHLSRVNKTQHSPHLNLNKCLASLPIQAPIKQGQTEKMGMGFGSFGKVANPQTHLPAMRWEHVGTGTEIPVCGWSLECSTK